MSQTIDMATLPAIQIQKPGGHFHEASQLILRRTGLATNGENKPGIVTLANQQFELMPGRMGDAFGRVASGGIDCAIVSSDALQKWQREWQAGEAAACGYYKSKPNEPLPFKSGPALGLAGAAMMLSLSTNYTGQNWQNVLRHDCRIVTSDYYASRQFLAEHFFDPAKIHIDVQTGGVENWAHRIGAPMILDLVATGQSAFQFGYVPTVKIDESVAMLIYNPRTAATPAMQGLLYSIDVNRAATQDELRQAYIKKLRVYRDQGTISQPARAFVAQRIAQLTTHQI